MRKSVIGLIAGSLATVLAGTLCAPAVSAQYFRFGKNRVAASSPDWFTIQTDHFDLYYPEGVAELARFAGSAAEGVVGELALLFGHAPQPRIPILVYPEQDAFLATNAVDLEPMTEAIGGVTELFKNRVAIPFSGDHRAFARVIRHEVVHAVVNQVYYGGSLQAALHRGVTTRLPLWFGEGLAEYVAFGNDAVSDVHVRDALRARVLGPLRDLDGYMAYRGGQSFWNWFGRRFGRAEVAAVLDTLRHLRSPDDALTRITGLTMDSLSSAWQSDETARLTLPDAEHSGFKTLAGIPEDLYVAAPSVSPDGKRVAFVGSRDGTFHVFVTSIDDPGDGPRRVLTSGAGGDVEQVRVLTPGLSWDADSRRLAVAARRGETETVVVVDTGDPLPDGGAADALRFVDARSLDRVLAVDWMPGGSAVILSAVRLGRSDLYRLDLATGTLSAITDDIHDDLAPAVSPDGKRIAWHSDRAANAEVDPGATASSSAPQFDLYVMESVTGRVMRVTDTPWDEWRADWSAGGTGLRYLTDRTGVPNLEETSLPGVGAWRSPVRVLTSTDPGLLDFSVGDDRVVAISLDAGRTVLGSVDATHRRETPPPLAESLRPTLHLDTSRPGVEALTPRRYRLEFSTDLVFGSAGYDPLYGAQGSTQMHFSDLLGNHRIRAATNLVLDLRRSDYMVAYDYLRRRTDWSVSVAHSARLLSDRSGTVPRYLQYRLVGAGLSAGYPIDTFRRIDIESTVLSATRADIDDPAAPRASRSLFIPRIVYTRDMVSNGFLFPVGGSRTALSLSGGMGRGSGFVNLLADHRTYVTFGPPIDPDAPFTRQTLAIRLSAAASTGRNAPKYYAAGTANWLNPGLGHGIAGPVVTIDDFLLATPIAPLRGFRLDAADAHGFALANMEWRVPLLALAPPGPIGPLLTWRLEGRVFADAALVGNRSLLGAGAGLRGIVLGVPVGLDLAWPVAGMTDTRRGVERGMHVYWSIGTDF